jgi:CHAT domain-containing protein/tetratricopeptide (TPR) repeat protein
MRAFLSGFLLCVACVARCAGQEPGNIYDLAPEHSLSVLLTPERAATVRLNLSYSEAEEIFLDTTVPDISLRVVSSDGTEIQSWHIATAGWAVIPLAVGVKRHVQLFLSTESPVEGLPGIRVRIEPLSIPLSTLPTHIRAAELFSSAQTLHRSLRAEDLRRAITEFKHAAAEWGRCGDLYGEALALAGEGESQIELSQYEEAIKTLKHAVGLEAKNGYLLGWLSHLEARVYLDQWEPKQARGFAQEEMRLGKEIDDPALIALARTDLVGVAYWGEDSHANEIADRANTEAVSAGVPETLALERRWKAWLEENDEHMSQATMRMSEAEAYFRRSGDLRTALEATGQVALAVSQNGDLYAALARFAELEPIAKTAGNNLEYGILVENIGAQYLGLGKPSSAEVYFHQAESAYANAHFRLGLMLIHGSLCETELRLGELSNAVANCKLSVTLARQIQDPVFIGIALCQLGIADRKAERLTRAFEDFTDAARNSQIGKDLRWESKERIQLGEVLQKTGRRREALAEYLRAESLSHGVADPASLLEAQYSAARWYVQDGQYEKANAELIPSLEKIEAARQLVANSTLQATYFAAERKCYELAVDLRMRQFERDPIGGGDALALDLSEQSRARGLLDAQTSKTGGRERGEVQANLIRSNIAADRAFDRRLKLLVNGSAKRELQASAAELTQALGDLERSEDVAHTAAREAPKPAPTMSVAAIEQASISSSVTFLEYELGDEHSYLWMIRGGKRKSFVLPARGQLEGMVKRWRVLAGSQEGSGEGTSAKLQHLSADLSCALLGDAVDAGMTRIVIVPDGALAMLPFAALPEKGCSSSPGEPLVVGHEITSTPSLSVFFSQKQKAENGGFHGQVAIVADPVFDAGDPRATALKAGILNSGSHPVPAQETAIALPRLLNAGFEASAIQEVVTKAAGKDQVFLAQGFDASLDTVLSPTMLDYRIWHLATHGIYDESMPEFSGLVFSLFEQDGSARFGFLKAQDIARLNVPAELVVLSACDSAAGENLSGEGVMGLSYSFLRAGARQVVSTLWSIDDVKSRELMIAFYKELMRNGGNTAAALRQSQLIVMRQPHSSAPYYWAGFELTSLGE